MKRNLLIAIAVLLMAAVGIAQVPAEKQVIQVVTLFTVPVSRGDSLPQQVGTQFQLDGVAIQEVTPTYLIASAWLSNMDNPKQKFYADLFRVSYKSGKEDRYAWVAVAKNIQFHLMFAELGKEWKDGVGPVPLSSIQKLGTQECAELGDALLVSVTTDAGTLKDPRPYYVLKGVSAVGDARVENRELVSPKYDTKDILQCDKGNFYRRIFRFNGYSVEDYDSKFKDIRDETDTAPVIPSYPKEKWSPAVQTTKTCVVPIERVCP